jgi:hypothetical protein
VRYYQGDQEPKWQDPPPPAILTALMSMLERTVQDMRDVAADFSFEVASNVATGTVQQGIEQSQNKWQSFLGDLADWHSRVMRHCLLLTARHYSEPRLIAINGRFGPERIDNFLGSHLMGQVNVRVSPDSLVRAAASRSSSELAWIQANWPGYLSPEVAIGALHSGTAENLIRSYEVDIARVNRVIQAIADGTVLDMPPRQEQVPGQPDPLTGETGTRPQTVEVGNYMPSQNDSLPIWKHMFGDFMKTPAFERLARRCRRSPSRSGRHPVQEAQQQQRAFEATEGRRQQFGSENAAASRRSRASRRSPVFRRRRSRRHRASPLRTGRRNAGHPQGPCMSSRIRPRAPAQHKEHSHE